MSGDDGSPPKIAALVEKLLPDIPRRDYLGAVTRSRSRTWARRARRKIIAVRPHC